MQNHIRKLTGIMIAIALIVLNGQFPSENDSFDVSIASLLKTASAAGEGSSSGKYIKVTWDGTTTYETVTVLCPDGTMKMAQMSSVYRTTTCHLGGNEECTSGSSWIRTVISPC